MAEPRIIYANFWDFASTRGLGPFITIDGRVYEQVPIYFFVDRESRRVASDFYDVRFTIRERGHNGSASGRCSSKGKGKGRKGGVAKPKPQVPCQRSFIMSAEDMLSVRPAEGAGYYAEPPVEISGGFDGVRTILIPRRHSLVTDEMERIKGESGRGLGLSDLGQKMSDVNARLTTFYMCWVVLDQLRSYTRREYTGAAEDDDDSQQRVVYLIQTAGAPAPQTVANSLRRQSGRLQDFLTAITGGRVAEEPFWLSLGRLFTDSGPRVALMLA